MGVRAALTRTWLVVLVLTAAGAAAAAGYALTAPKHYRATADLLVSPVSASDPTFAGLDVFRDDGGKRTAAASAAALLTSPQVADAVRAQLGITRPRDALLAEVDARVVGASDVVAVTVEDTSPATAAQLANAFADALVSQRTAGFQSQLATTIRRDRQLLAAAPPAAGAELQRRLVVLQGFQGQPDPTLRHAVQASAPSGAAWPSVPRLTGIGAAAGLAAGLLAALLLLGLRRGRAPVALPRLGDEVSERVIARLEQRLVARVDALRAEQERLAARESALGARERDVEAKLAELRTAAAAPAPDDGAAAAREAGVAARERELLARTEELDARVETLTRRELELARAAVAARSAPPPAPEPVSEPVPEPAPGPVSAPEPTPPPAPPPPPPGGPVGTGRYNLTELERLVEARGERYPDRLDEWTSYLFVLRDYARPDGSIPSQFDWLIADAFGELIA